MSNDPNILASETLARLYESQGQPDRAKALRGRIEGTGKWILVEQRPDASHRGSRHAHKAQSIVTSAIRCRVAADQVSCDWTIVESDMQTARKHINEDLRADARPALRIVSYHREHADAPTFWHIEDIAPNGSVLLESDKPLPLWISIAVGLIAQTGRFQPIAHAPSMAMGTSRH